MTSISSTLAGLLSSSQPKAVSKTSSELAEIAELAALMQGQQPSSFGPAYTLDLSQSAQDTLSGASSVTPTSSTSATGYSNIQQQPQPIQLTDAQKATIQSIFDKYKNAPLTADTLNSIDADLHNAGVAPDQLAQATAASNNPEATPTFGELLASLMQNDTSSTSNSAPAPLTADQQKTVQAIFDKYKDAPKTPDTFKQIASDLKQAGIDPKQVFHHHGGGAPAATTADADGDDDGSVAPDSVFNIGTTTSGTGTPVTAPQDLTTLLEQILQNFLKPQTPPVVASSDSAAPVTDPTAVTNG